MTDDKSAVYIDIGSINSRLSGIKNNLIPNMAQAIRKHVINTFFRKNF